MTDDPCGWADAFLRVWFEIGLGRYLQLIMGATFVLLLAKYWPWRKTE